MGQQPAGKLKGFLASLQLEIQVLGPHPTERTSGLKRISVWADLCQNGHCQLWNTAKEKAEEHELVSYCLYRYIPGNSWFFCNYLSLIQHRKCGDTGIYFLFRLAHLGGLWFRGSWYLLELRTLEENNVGTSNIVSLSLSELNQMKQN